MAEVTSQISILPTVREMQEAILEKLVIARNAFPKRWADKVCVELGKYIRRNFARTDGFKAQFVLKLDGVSNKIVEKTATDSDLKHMYFCFGLKAPVDDLFSFEQVIAPPYREPFEMMLDEVQSRLETAGYRVERWDSPTSEYSIFEISWGDGAFHEAMEKFSDESELDAFRHGVPLSDILA